MQMENLPRFALRVFQLPEFSFLGIAGNCLIFLEEVGDCVFLRLFAEEDIVR